MKSVISGGFFLLSGSVIISALTVSNAGNDFMNGLGAVFILIGIAQIVIGLFFEDD
ncbi:hypothetical protein Cst_c21780 [Thermoclostridium stercorarium subsp. stercorarium DSM 8532]|jgi:predicted phage tail protein|uniref:Uncharacterized protein n=1 Tax=Thermoclostridium stercorarium (strain ATCC 35414 / DSM 8532 / NCIMB 11754) TaxID=1121335 RepID=L7VQS7_THES1|nr:hypothetical protein [Thermoclostridium stercorarium]AGC69142.1 hypothetical protein Cst_c21780 [Thermoclostridium stercorarium subsp. stercorarium DSM 8532]AGI40111.1 hypothetical protein Clst_2082 [Thermoclostridium stercorarium subsp. stercorarium DSM 8532]UZQ85111.1 hypothetical protein ODU73_002219 [Thermoclostridium stercorarium]